MQKLEIKKKEINALPISNAGGDEKLIINFMWPKEHDLIGKIGMNNIIYLIQIATAAAIAAAAAAATTATATATRAHHRRLSPLLKSTWPNHSEPGSGIRRLYREGLGGICTLWP